MNSDNYNKSINKIKSVFPYLAAPVVVSTLLLLVYCIHGVYPFARRSIAYYDMAHCLVPLYYHAWDFMHGNKSLFFDWYSGLGGSMADSMGNFTLNPFNIFLLFTKREDILYFMSWFLLIKTAFASFAMSFYCRKKYGKINCAWIMLLGILYASCGFIVQFYTLIHILDIVAIFPFLMYGYDNILNKRGFVVYTVLLSIIMITSIYYAFPVCIYIILRTYICNTDHDDEETKRLRVIYIALGAAIAFIISAFSVIPSVIQLLSSSRALIAGDRTYSEIIVSFLSSFKWQKIFMLYGSEIGLAAMVIMIFLRDLKRRGKNIIMILLLMLPILIEPINLLWHGGSYVNFPMRFAYILTFEILSFTGAFISDRYCPDEIDKKAQSDAKFQKIVGHIYDFLSKYAKRFGKDINLTIIFLAVLILTSWIADDSYHGFVMSRNLAMGRGFVYNIGERVNASTCPLFSIILGIIHLIFGRVDVIAPVFCAIITTVAFYTAIKRCCRYQWQKLFIFASALLSYCFISYSNCGLENCLLYLFDTIYVYLVFVKRRFDARHLVFIALDCSLILLTRMDAGILFFLTTVFLFLFKAECKRHKMMISGLCGLVPFFIWEIFSVFYYGFPFPNTFYAKESTGFPSSQYIQRGFRYLLVSALYDPLLILIIILAFIVLISRKDVLCVSMALGIVLKTLYLVRVGGDFMVGRFYTDMYWTSLLLLVLNVPDEISLTEKGYKAMNVLFKTLAFAFMASIILRPIALMRMYPMGPVADERKNYFGTTGSICRIFAFIRNEEDPVFSTFDDHDDEILAAKSIEGSVGAMLPWAAGIVVWETGEYYYEVDPYALADPLLVHLPAVYSENWRIGHQVREIPDGYAESVRTGKNMIEDNDLHEYYDKILLITRGELFDKERLDAIIDINMGRYDHLIENYSKRNK